MAGTLDYSLTADSTSFAAGVQSANAQLNQMGRTLAGLIVPMNAVNMAQGPAASFWIQGNNMLPGLAAKVAALTGKSAPAASGLQSMAAGGKAAAASMHALSGVMMIFGGVAPQVSNTVLGVTSGMHALKLVAVATGLSLTSLGVAGLGVVGILATLSYAFEAWQAKQLEAASATDRGESIQKNADRYKKLIEQAVIYDRMTKEEATRWQSGFDIPGESNEMREGRNRGVASRLQELGMFPPSDAEKAARQVYEFMLRGVQGRNVSDKEGQREEIYQATAKALEEAAKAAKESRQNPEPLRLAIMAERDRKLAELDQAPTPAEKIRGSFLAPSQTSLEKIGFVMNNGRAARDPGLETAVNTRQLLTEAKITNTLLGKGGGTVLRE